MSTWNYRVVRHRTLLPDEEVEVHYAIHEVYYGDDGVPTGMTKDPVTFVGDTREEVIKSLLMAARNSQALDVFDPPEEWKE